MHQAMYKNAAQAWLPIIMARMAARGDPPMPLSTEHVWSPNGLMSMTLMLSICHGLLSHHILTQSSIYGIFWNDA